MLGRPVNVHRWLGTAVSLLAWPRAVVADWVNGASISNHPIGGEALYLQLVERWREPHVVPIVAGHVGFQPGGVAELGGGFARVLKEDDPLLVHVVNPAGLEYDPDGRPTFSVGRGRTKLVVFSPTAGPATLSLTLAPYAGRPGTRLVGFLSAEDFSHRAIRLATEGAAIADVPLSGETSAVIPILLPAGFATVALLIDEGRGELDARVPVTVVGLSLQPASRAAERD